MTTIDAEITIDENGEITVQTPKMPDLPSGHYSATILLNDQQQKIMPKTESAVSTRPPLKFTGFPIGLVSEDYTFRREDLYEDEEEELNG